MKIPKQLNVIRRKVMRGLTKNMGQSNSTVKPGKEVIIKKILISRPNHRLGNLLLLSPIVQEVNDTFPDARIDLFVKGSISPIIFKNYKNIDQIIQLPKKPFSNLLKYIRSWSLLRWKKYDLVINTSHSSSSGKISTQLANGDYKFFNEWNDELHSEYPDYPHAAKNPIYNLRKFLTHLGFEKNTGKVPFLNIKLSPEEIETGKRKLEGITKNDKKTICLFTNATGDKCYSNTWWASFYESLKMTFPDYNIVELLPVENISRLDFKIPSFYSTDIREIGAFIANTSVFIAADNGVMHLASAVGTPTIGLFMVTDENAYKPYNDKSFSINTNNVKESEIPDLIKTVLQ
ncbi:lipopolysaccharide heptosyltransferase family protein [Chryseobacterium sp. B21-037]|uniref:glycosyltransferase family 9 protein n=1 Tax=Chryseobacterium sp. B21-037 TaxID=2926038 RepID=UPI0023592290|nr:glycosyltransferase family 9 protein [Chryseobacterium sp. B21-037]MDC8105959.1 lipopolysaccharide heptosyltransferase family protein [Chryseobacterium sp. B21-037]